MRILLILFLFVTSNIFSQMNEEAIKKLNGAKQLLELELITQKEFDSIANELKNLILKSDVEVKEEIQDGFYINDEYLLPERFAESKTDVLGAAFSYGIAGGGTKSFLTGLKSKNEFTKGQKMYLKIKRNVVGQFESSLAYQQFFSFVQSPNDFALVKLKISSKDKSRWIKTGSMSLTSGYNFSIKKKEFLDFDFKQVDEEEGLFELDFNLPAGEYAFVYIGTSAYSNNSIFSFSIK